MARSLPRSQQPWQTFECRVTITRGRAEVYAVVQTSYVTGVVGATGVRPDVVWEGVIGRRSVDTPVTPEDAAWWAQDAISRAFPALF